MTLLYAYTMYTIRAVFYLCLRKICKCAHGFRLGFTGNKGGSVMIQLPLGHEGGRFGHKEPEKYPFPKGGVLGP